MSEYLIERNGFYYYYRRVPKHLKPYEKRTYIKVSLKTKEKNVARKRAMIQNEAVERFWRELVTSPARPGDREDRFREAVRAARLHGFVYRDISDIASNAELGEVVDRLLAFKQSGASERDGSELRDALFGTASEAQILLSEAFAIFRPRCVDRLAGKTDHQIRKWENPRRLAFKNFIEAVGDKPISKVTRKDVLAFQEWWLERIRSDGVNAHTANKHFGYVKDILDTVFVACDIEPAADAQALFARVKLKAADDSRRSYEASYVQDVLLDSGEPNGMNLEARAHVYFMADTGARVGELFRLLPEDIFLEAEIPFIHIRANEKQGLKTAHSDRQIPLVGAALFAAQQFPQGLSRYSSADSASTQIHKFFRENRLNPTKDHSLYSLRHTFKDRLRDVQAPEEVIDNLMGHKSRGPKYGRGHILETKFEWLRRIAFDVSRIKME